MYQKMLTRYRYIGKAKVIKMSNYKYSNARWGYQIIFIFPWYNALIILMNEETQAFQNLACTNMQIIITKVKNIHSS